ncbi:MAG: SDR family oxidoreductase, partial [Syntrophales bacterium]|nr:SDR family oxidoreductase [Syntrophales bacterium]
DIDAHAVDRVANEVGSRGGRAISSTMDVTNSGDVDRCVAQSIKEFGRIHILVNNAGIEGHRANIWDADADGWRRTIEVHLFGNFNCTKAFLPKIMEQEWGRVITIASIQAKQASVQNSSYTAAKHALVGITRTVAHEVAMAGYPKVTVNAICPGIVATNLVLGPGGALEQIAAQYNIPKEQVIEVAKSKCLQGRLLEVEEVAAMAVFLASEDAKGVTGQAINICGGAVFH